MIRTVALGIFICVVGTASRALAVDCEDTGSDTGGGPTDGFFCNPLGFVASGAVFTAGESNRQGTSLGLIEGLLEDSDTEEEGGGASADLGGGFNLFVTPFGVFADQDEKRELGFDSQRFGFVGGVDYTTGYGRVGLAFDYSREDIDLDGDAGEVDIDEYGLSIFGQIEPVARWYLFGAARYAWDDYEVERRIEAGNVAEGETDGWKIGLLGGAGHRLTIADAVNLDAAATLDWQRAEIDGYEEEGGTTPSFDGPEGDLVGGPNLRYQDDDYDSLRSILSLDLLKKSTAGKQTQLLPGVFAMYIHEFKNDSRTINAEFADDFGLDSLDISYETNNPDRDYFIVGGSLIVLTNTRWTAALTASTWLGHDYRSEQIITLGLRVAL